MVLGFYERGLNSNELQGESVRFVLNHYGFDVRRDTTITKKIHESLLEEQTTTKQSEELLTYLLRLERHLSGKYRFAPVGGRRWFTLGLALSELSSEKEMQRVLDLPVVKQHGNFEVELDEKDPLWKNYVVKPKVENFVSFVESAKLTDTIRDADLIYNLRVQKPPRKLEYWEEMKEKLLQAWVIVFAVWISFWAVDEELITLFALIFLKHRQTKILEEEAEKTGGKVYIASSSGLTYR
ncbi:hypothetical protein AGDE_11555 [Angomonas deanei]|nr:hypothetical protein AGDE_11555 [Angomonas deanei]|eukprot:EPY26071.1 hypothetical protein AGDE_11555 [Angomonas deanei]